MNLVIQMCVFFILRVEKIFFSEFMLRLRLMLNCQDADSQDSIKIELNSTHFELYISVLFCFTAAMKIQKKLNILEMTNTFYIMSCHHPFRQYNSGTVFVTVLNRIKLLVSKELKNQM